MDGHHHKFELSPLFIGLLGILSGAAIVATFHCIAIGWCSSHHPPPPPNSPSNRPQIIRRTNTQDDNSIPSTTSNSAAQLITVYKHTNEAKEALCAVCLGEYTEGEELRVLPECGHSFHLQCIDMWLRSHPNCPLCRAGAAVPPPPPQRVVVSLPNSGRVPPPVLYGSPDFGGYDSAL